MKLSLTGEVGEFLDNNQLQEGSQDKCRPEAVATVYYSVAPGKQNPSKPRDIELMAEADYLSFIGPNKIEETICFRSAILRSGLLHADS